MIMEEALQLVLSRLDECGIPYMITGSLASNLHGVPRATQDADVVIEADRGSLDRFLQNLGAAFYASPEAAGEALKGEGIFNVVHLGTGFKVDLIIRKSRSLNELEREPYESVVTQTVYGDGVGGYAQARDQAGRSADPGEGLRYLWKRRPWIRRQHGTPHPSFGDGT